MITSPHFAVGKRIGALVQFDLGLQSTATPGRLNKLQGVGIKPYISDVAAAVGDLWATINMDTRMLIGVSAQEQELPDDHSATAIICEASVVAGKLRDISGLAVKAGKVRQLRHFSINSFNHRLVWVPVLGGGYGRGDRKHIGG
jgi:hypothetical protein